MDQGLSADQQTTASYIPDDSVRPRLLYLDGWRGLSILLVLLGHFFPVSGISLGVLGVEFFFVLSGRLMAEILFIERYPLKKFFKRRFSRVYPALFVYVLITMIVLSPTFLLFKWKAALTALTFTYNYAGLFRRAGALDHIWSLCVEEHSYVILAAISLIAAYKKMAPLKIIAGLAIAAMVDGAASYLLSHNYELTYWRTDVHIASILTSAAFCILMRERHGPDFLRSPFLAGASLFVAIVFFIDAVPIPLHYIVSSISLAIAVNSLDTALPKLKSILSFYPLVLIGTWSFSLYLWQQPFYKFVYFREASPVVMLTGAIICALISFYFVERPLRSWLNKKWKP